MIFPSQKLGYRAQIVDAGLIIRGGKKESSNNTYSPKLGFALVKKNR